MINKGRIGLLVAALRSGLYEQGRQRLHLISHDEETGTDKHTWCCLGVAADVARRFGLEFSTELRNLTWEDGLQCELMGDTSVFMPPSVQQWYGIEHDNPRLKLEDGRLILAAAMNDNGWADENGVIHEATFEDVADAFERAYLKEDA